MSAITFERPFVEAEKPSTQPPNRACSRKEEFHAALDSYIDRYAAEQANRLSVLGSRNNHYALIWLQPLRHLRKATRQVRLFSLALAAARIGCHAPIRSTSAVAWASTS